MSDPECKLTEHDYERAEDYHARAGEKIEIRRKIRRKVWEEKQKRNPDEARIKDLKEKERILSARIKLMWDRKMAIERPQRWFDFEREKFNGSHRIVYKGENHTAKPEKALPNDPRWMDRHENPRSTPRSRARSGAKSSTRLSGSSKSKEPRSSGSVPENSKNSKNLKPSTSIPSQISAYANKNVKPSKPSRREVFYVPEDIRLQDKRPTGYLPSDPKSKKVAVTFDADKLVTGVSCSVEAKKVDDKDYKKLYDDLVAKLDRENYFKDKDGNDNDADDEDDEEDILR